MDSSPRVLQVNVLPSQQNSSYLSFAEEFIRGFQVFEKECNGFIGAGELRYVLTQLGEKMSDEEVDELLKGVQIGACVFSFLYRWSHLVDLAAAMAT